MLRSQPVDGFRLAYERVGAGPPVVLLHGWPGDHGDYRAVTPLLSDRADVLVPDLRGFGASDKHHEDPATAYSADAQARSVVALIDELGLDAPVIAGYDIGSRIAQTIAHAAADRVRAIVACPPLPGPVSGS
jgi:pimeloyl-ACP methyl ester carboxylesterase